MESIFAFFLIEGFNFFPYIPFVIFLPVSIIVFREFGISTGIQIAILLLLLCTLIDYVMYQLF